MSTKHAHCTCYTSKPYTYRFSCSWLHKRLHSVALSTFVIKLLRQCSPVLANKSDLNTAWRLYEARWRFYRTIKIGKMTLLRDFTAKHSHTVFTCSVHTIDNLCSHWTNLQRTLLEVTSHVVWYIHAKHLKLHVGLHRCWQLKGLPWPLHDLELIPSRTETFHIF